MTAHGGRTITRPLRASIALLALTILLSPAACVEGPGIDDDAVPDAGLEPGTGGAAAGTGSTGGAGGSVTMGMPDAAAPFHEDAGTGGTAVPDAGVDLAMPEPDAAMPEPDVAMPEPDAALPTPDTAPPEPDAPLEPPTGWVVIDTDQFSIDLAQVSWRYELGYLHSGNGMSMRKFIDKETGEDYSGGFDAIFKNLSWNKQPVTFTKIEPAGWSVDIHVTTGLTQKIDRVYYGFPGVEIEYLQNDAEWIEDFFHVAGEAETDIAFVMYGMNDVVGVTEGQRLWKASEDLAKLKFNQRVNRGDTFIESNGSTVEACTYKGHFIYGFVNRNTGRGMGAVYEISLGLDTFRIWWTEKNRIEIEFAPMGKLTKRWLYAVKGGKDEVFSVGKRLIDAGRVPVP